MAPLEIEGDTLGDKHKSYNKIVNDAIKNNPSQLIDDINYEESDLDNLFKIDIASNNRNVEYLLTVLKGQDMLYILRAIRKSTWLVTEPAYTHVINPNYLSNELFPQMTSKAINKFLLHIRINLKDEKRVEEFFNYYKEKDLKASFKWLPRCSVTFIENVIENHANDMEVKLFKRLCEKSISFLDILLKNYTHYTYSFLISTMFLVNYNAERYLDILETNDVIINFNFGSKFTTLLMKKCGDRIKENLEKYCRSIHIPTFAKYIEKDEVKDLILKNLNNRRMSNLFSHTNIKHFINRLPKENRFELIKEIFINKKYKDDASHDKYVELYCSPKMSCNVSSEITYTWYIYAPFETAFTELKKLIRSESNPTERTAMFGVILTCAKNNPHDIQTLLKYYRENHINESYKFKSQFVNLVVCRTKTHRYNKVTWGYLNDLFISMEVYNDTDKNVQSCVQSVILYNVIHDENIPEIIEKNFVFETFKKNHNKFTQDEKDKVFSYLFNYITLKLKRDIISNDQLTEAVGVLTNALQLLEDWNKELHDFPNIVSKIKEIVNIKKTNKSWDNDIAKLYNIPNSWKKLLFTESIILSPNQKACINALKHDPQLLESCKEEVTAICVRDNELVGRFLRKVRIYWSHSLGYYFKNVYMDKLNQNNNHKAIITGLCTLLPQKEFTHLAQKYVPNQTKIDWNQHDELELSLCKHIATCLHLARPQPSLDIALSYAKGDYMQYILPSLGAILYNMSCKDSRQYVSRLLDAPVSLQKHGIQYSFIKLTNNELKQLFSDIWKSNKNSTIRSNIFTQTFNMLCRERDPAIVKEVWELLSMFIDNLTSEENMKIYAKLGAANKVHLSVRAEFFMKSYRFLKSLPAKVNCNKYVNRMHNYMKDIMEFLDDHFVGEIFLESFDKRFSTQEYRQSHLVAAFLLSCRTERTQMDRYNKIFVPILNRVLVMWDTRHDNKYYVRYNLGQICRSLLKEFVNIVLDKEIIFPIAMLRDLQDRLYNALPFNENYILLTGIKLALNYIIVLDGIFKREKELIIAIKSKKVYEHSDDDRWNPLHAEAAPEFGRVCLECLKDDVAQHFPSIYDNFAEALNWVFREIRIGNLDKLSVLKSFLKCKEFIQGYLLVIKLLPSCLYDSEIKTLTLELLNDIRSHPSEEIKIHSWCFVKNSLTRL